MRKGLLLLTVLVFAQYGWAESPQNEVRAVVTAFSEGMHDRNIAHVQKALGNDVVAILDGSRYDGWETLRDRALIPEFAHPAAPATFQIVKISATGDMAWAYTQASVSEKSNAQTTVWTVLVLERRGKEWKIVLLDRSAGRAAVPPAKKARRR